MVVRSSKIEGPRHVIDDRDDRYPELLRQVENPPKLLYVIGEPQALQPGLAVVGARRATPYGVSCTRRFAMLAAERGIPIISGGARGCDSVAHEAALAVNTPTIAFLGGGLDQIYPIAHVPLFQRIVNAGGALASEHPWDFEPLGFTFRARNRLIAGLARATLIVEAGLPSGTFSTADAALAAGREVLVVPGAITSHTSKGSNRLLAQGAIPIVDDETFTDVLSDVFGILRQDSLGEGSVLRPISRDMPEVERELLAALDAEVMGLEALRNLVTRHLGSDDTMTWLMVWLAKAQRDGLIARYPDGRYGPCVAAC